MSFAPYPFKKHFQLVFGIFITLAFAIVINTAAYAQYNFAPSALSGTTTLSKPTSVQFGPDGRLYVAQQSGFIRIYTVQRIGPNNYTVTATENIFSINQIPNHNDDGVVNPDFKTRQVTGIVVAGTAANPIIYVTSSDPRVGGGPTVGEINIDTNAGILSMLSWNGTTWVKIDLVRGLPRAEENHAPNGLQLDSQNNKLYIAVGGNTNAGSPSTNFAYACEFTYSASIISVDLNAILAMPTKGTGNAAYKYDLPTLDDPTRANLPDGSDPNDPFGGDNGLNMAKLVPGGPVQIYASGFRNPYDLVITQSKRMYTIDNGANQGWGGYPVNEGTPNVTNAYIPGEPGSTTASATEAVVNNLDNLHYIGNIDSYVPNSFYGGHPNPLRANPAGAGLYTSNGTNGAVWRNSTSGPNPLPIDWPPVPVEMANPIEGDFQMPGVNDNALLTFTASTNGIAEYTASNFNNALKGSLLAASFDGNIYRIGLTANGADATNARASSNKLNQEIPFASGFGAVPLDVTTRGDNESFPGTVWVADYGANGIFVFEPQDFTLCSGAYNSADDDSDHFTNADEVDNGTNPCSASSVPADFDHDFVSDRNDTDDDHDGIPDTQDFFPIDSLNGTNISMPIDYQLLNNDPGTGFFGLGFKGLMNNGSTNYLQQFDPQNLIAGGAVGAFTIVAVSDGDASGSLNNQQNAFQLGIKSVAEAGPFTIQTGMLGPFFNNNTPQNNQSQGIYIGTGDQDNYLKVVLNANNGAGGIEVVYENAGIPTSYQFPLEGGMPASFLNLYLSVDPNSGLVQPMYASNGGPIINAGSPVQVSGTLLNLLKNNGVFAVGIISTSRGATPFTATWDYINFTFDPLTAAGSWQTIVPAAGIDTAREETSYVQAGDKFYLLGGRGIKPVQAYDPVTKTWTDRARPPMEINHFQAVTLNGLIYAMGAFTGSYPHEVPLPNVYIYNPVTNVWLTGGTIPESRRRGSPGAAIYNNKIYMVGGITDGHWSGWVSWFDVYDPATNTWTALPDAPRTRDHFHVAIVNDKLYVIGGRRSSGITNQVFALTIPEVDVYDFATGQWSTLPGGSNLPTPRAGACTVVLGEEVIVVGGETNAVEANKETEALNVTTNTWRRLADLQQARHGTQAIVNNKGIYVVAGAGTKGGAMVLNSQELFSFFGAGAPAVSAITQSQLTAPANLSFGQVPLNTDSTKSITITNTGGTQDILISSLTINGDASYTVTNAYTMPFILPVGQSIAINIKFRPTVSGAHAATLVITHSGQGSAANVALISESQIPAYRINAGGQQVTNALGTFNADAYFTLGSTYSTNTPVSAPVNDAMYRTERGSSSNNGTFSYSFPVSNGAYTVILHFAEIFYTTTGRRVFDVSLEGIRVLDNYDIVRKVGAFTATTETFNVNVTDGTLNINFSALASEGGVNRPKISAIEILYTPATPVTYYRDADGDSYGNAAIPITATSLPQGYVTDSTDCNDGDATVHPGATEICDGKDNNCNGIAEEGLTTTYYQDLDNDGFGNSSSTTIDSCAAPLGYVANNTDCNDNDATIYPGAPELCDGKDNNCNKQTDEICNPSPVPVFRINTGGAQLTNSIGTFNADAYFTPVPGSRFSTTVAIAATTDDAMYQSERRSTANNGAFSYGFPVSNGQYTVVLHFAEIYFTAIGKRVFDVSIEGTRVLDNYDVFRKAGALTATTETFIVNVADGTLNINFSALAGEGGINRPKVSAIEILTATAATTIYYRDADGDGYGNAGVSTTATSQPAGYVSNNTDCNDSDGAIYPGAAELCDGKDNNCNGQTDEICNAVPVYRINAGGAQLTNSIGTFNADAYFTPVPGSRLSTTAAIATTTDDAIYQTERSATTNNGAFSYGFPVSNGQYTVVLHFAEIYFTAIGKRVFDVSIEGTRVLDNYDVFKKAGALTATTETFIVNVADGTLNINFSALAGEGGINRPKVSAIEILTATAANLLSRTGPAVTTSNQVKTQPVLRNEPPIQKLKIKIHPNPANNYFNIMVQSAVGKPITLKIIDLTGRTVQSINHLTANTSLLIGSDYRPGVYLLEAIQGTERVIMKLIKQSK